MKSTKFLLIASTMLPWILVFSIACRGPAAPEEVNRPPVAVATAAPVNAWDELVKAAQAEGTVVIYGTDIGSAVPALRSAFKEKFGLNMEFVGGRPPEVLAKLTAERKAGLYLADISQSGESTTLTDLKPMGATVSLPDLLLLPDAKDPKTWVGGQLPFLDEDRHVFMPTAYGTPQALVNTDLIKPGDLTSFVDLLDPKWKGKIAFSDPTVSGISCNILAAMYKTFGKDRALEIFRQLAKQDLFFSRDTRLLIEWVARGKYPMSIGSGGVIYGEFRNAGAPIGLVSFKEPRHVSGGPGTIALFSNRPHPKASQVYLNWVLTREGASVYAKALAYPSARVDVTNEWMESDTIPRAGDIFPDAETLKLRDDMKRIAGEIFGPYMK